jgi:hypothetical protein
MGLRRAERRLLGLDANTADRACCSGRSRGNGRRKLYSTGWDTKSCGRFQVVYTGGVSRKFILGAALLVLICVLLVAPMHEAMERYHTPFPVDGDFGAMVVTMLVGMCAGMAALTVPWFALMLALALLVTCLARLRQCERPRLMAHQKRLYSPPRKLLPLRI